MDEEQQMVVEFISTFNGSLDPKVWLTMVEEELLEVEAEEPNTPEHLKEICDLIYVSLGLGLCRGDQFFNLLSEEQRNRVNTLANLVGFQLDEAERVYPQYMISEGFKRVHESNMSKLGEDGKPIFREDGKVLKGPNYLPPVFDDMFTECPATDDLEER